MIILLSSSVLSAQFNGGDGDGHQTRLVIQFNLSGIPSGVRALYSGGVGDGADRFTTNATLSGQTLESIFAGGQGDGADRNQAGTTLGGQSLTLLYGGGQNDGFDVMAITVTTDGQSLARLFGGGSGDGFDGGGVAGALNGQSFAGLFTGGAGDGFSNLPFSGSVAGAMLDLYGGGAGDGFDEASGSFTINGVDLTILYGGGSGDGFDTELYLGVLPLPLTLISFDAFPEDKYVLLSWVTEDEMATDFFTIEKTRDGRAFATVGTADAAGYSEPGEQLHYDLRDEMPYDGTSFYRLRTTDLDGAISLSHLVEVNYSGADGWNFLLFPNPNTGQQLNVRPAGLADGTNLKLDILDAQGRSLLQKHLITNGDDHRVDLLTPLPSGSYLIRLTDERGQGQAKILIVR